MSKPMLALIAVGVSLLIIVGYWFFPRGGQGQAPGTSDFEKAQQESKEAADSIAGQGGSVKDAPNPLGRKAYAVKLSGATISDKIIDDLQTLGIVIDLDLSRAKITDQQLAQLNKVGLTTYLLKLDLSYTDISDAAIEGLKNMTLLKELNLTGSKCTKAGAERFKRSHASDKVSKFPNITVKI
jgi:uncharacterized protein YjbI with pentapeptide repeats